MLNEEKPVRPVGGSASGGNNQSSNKTTTPIVVNKKIPLLPERQLLQMGYKQFIDHRS
ncbi:MAG: hypothetical protein UR93_C0023G0017 [Berkelbacteria bacterium GW2011_GWA2_35_9]|uniref:Uncharacterized protein n=1 Tax=Berkelbacteria bacterium GW2011_GWA2_35_9 TaxID=1618333 RepID=A0A0G0D3X6_9BACT|nr:MAG: hypothetical protein UR93_C0023G0017 [Berkelbacteria bacterium GW2011_GWA2_35_9]